MSGELRALALLAASGLFQALFAVPMKRMRGWRWEHVWTAQAVTANLLFPLLWALSAPAAFWQEAARIPAGHWWVAYRWGLLWGVGGIAYGLSLSRLGIALANSFIFGVSVATGALLPLAFRVVEPPRRVGLFLAGLVLCVLTTVLIGLFRHRGDQKPLLAMPFRLQSYPKVIGVAIVSGIASAGYGLAFSFQFRTLATMTTGDLSPFSASLAVLLPTYLGGALVAIPVGIWCAARSRTLSLFTAKFAIRNWMQALLMGACAAATAICYNLGSTMDGHPAPNIAFSIFVTCIVLSGTLLGFATGETRADPPAANAGLLLGACGLATAAWLLNSR